MIDHWDLSADAGKTGIKFLGVEILLLKGPTLGANCNDQGFLCFTARGSKGVSLVPFLRRLCGSTPELLAAFNFR